ncbi:MAG TPA: protein kinase, partial [Myxococcales bacterium]|nr:protein kinase [Myxococcales bacterium]
MTPDRWTRIDQLFHSALDHTPAGRAAFLAEACGSDSSLRREIESLLAAHESAGDFLEEDSSQEGSRLQPGQRLGPYEIVEPLGRGGMGLVYRARDTRLLREVAVKVMARAASGAPQARRLVEEARTAAALSHPNILPVHDVGEEEGVFFVVCELLQGETLAARLSRGPPLGAARCLELAREIARGLRAAHEKGIVHRDVKPENLFLTASGPLKILDFGLAKRIPLGAAADGRSSLSLPGMMLGTVGYMSPEQVRGEPVDARSDVFSFGAVLYEMLSGRRAFGGSPVEAMAATLHADPPPLEATEAPPALAEVAQRCLQRDAGQRFPSARELCEDLEGVVLDPVSAAPRLSAPRDGRRSLAVPPFRELGGAGESAAARAPSIAVLPLHNLSADREQEYFSDGLAEELLNLLAKVPGLKVAARTSAFSFKGRDVDVRAIGERLGVATVLEGSVRKSGDRIRISAQLINAADGYHLWSETYDRKLTDVFAVQDEIAGAVVAALKLKLLAPPSSKGRMTANSEAHNQYLLGRQFFIRGNS